MTNYELIVAIYDSGLSRELELKSTVMLVLIGLARYYNPRTRVVYPSLETLSTKLGISLRSVTRAIEELIDKKVINKAKRGKNNFYEFSSQFELYTSQSVRKVVKLTDVKDAKLTSKQYNWEHKNLTGISYQKADEIINQISKDKETSCPPTEEFLSLGKRLFGNRF